MHSCSSLWRDWVQPPPLFLALPPKTTLVHKCSQLIVAGLGCLGGSFTDDRLGAQKTRSCKYHPSFTHTSMPHAVGRMPSETVSKIYSRGWLRRSDLEQCSYMCGPHASSSGCTWGCITYRHSLGTHLILLTCHRSCR